jgi:hypothetical protein
MPFFVFQLQRELTELNWLRLMHSTELKTNSYLTFTWIFSFHEQKDLDFQVDFRPTESCINSDAFPCFGFCGSPLSSEVVMCSGQGFSCLPSDECVEHVTGHLHFSDPNCPCYANQVKDYTEAALRKSDLERTQLQKVKTGVFTGAYAKNPATAEAIPVWVADYVLGR